MRSWPALTITFDVPEAPLWDRHSGERRNPELVPGFRRGDERAMEPPSATRDFVSAAIDGLDVVAIDEPSETVWRVCFRDDAARAVAVDALAGEPGLSVETLEMPDEDWARRNQAALTAIRVGPIVVTPPWDDAATHRPEGSLTIVIEPGMGFGSGHHATTRLCLAALLKEPPTGKSVLDIGTGSGVLAIAAAMMGAESVLAVDVDPEALESARTNAALNVVPPVLQFREADFRKGGISRFDIVLANLTGGMLVASVDDVMRCCVPGGTIILSGITAEESNNVTSAFARRANILQSEEEAGWNSLVVRP